MLELPGQSVHLLRKQELLPRGDGAVPIGIHPSTHTSYRYPKVKVLAALSGSSPNGAVAQLGEHLLCKEGVRSSSLLGSTTSL